jgi:hypothetical protein
MKKMGLLSAALALLGASAFSQTEADFKVELTADSKGAVITGYTGAATAVNIPAVIQGMPVREIGKKAFYRKDAIISVAIPEGVTVIRENAFFHGSPIFSKLERVTLPSTLRVIEKEAFYGTALKSIVIPEGVTEIGTEAFCYCYELASIRLPSTLPIIGNKVFSCDSSFPNKVLRSIEIPEGVTEIGRETFENCIALALVTLPQSLKKIGNAAFSRTAIESITLPPKLTKIEANTFINCKNLPSIVIPEGVTDIGGAAFGGCTRLSSVTLPSTIKSIGKEAFAGCPNLTAITIPAAVVKIKFNKNSFVDCEKISLALQAQLKKLGYEDGF